METLVGGTKPVITYKNEFIEIIEHFLNFLTVGIMMEGSQIVVLQPNHPLSMSGFDWDLDGTNQAFSCSAVSV